MLTASQAARAWPWSAGTATGIGSVPGTDIVEAVKIVFGELSSLAYLPELPARGPGADMIGRSATLLAGLPVELYAGAWRLAGRAGVDQRRTRDLLERDLDALAAAADGYTEVLKVQASGPWTLAANLDLPAGGRVLRDYGAARDLVAALTDGLRWYLREVQRRVPAARLLLQLDEPSLPAVLAGRVPSPSGLYTLRSVPASTVEATLRSIVRDVGVPVVVHCCAAGLPLSLVQRTGAAAVSLDLDRLGGDRQGGQTAVLDELGAALDGGLGLFAGVLPSTGVLPGAGASAARLGERARQLTSRVERLWTDLGLARSRLPGQVVLTPACGLAGASADYARAALTLCGAAARRLAEAAG